MPNAIRIPFTGATPSCGFWSLLSGCAGYTCGCAGIWNWDIPVMQDGPILAA
jgi:hypothetical protein